MTEQFIGKRVLVDQKVPRHQILGTVKRIEGTELTLENSWDFTLQCPVHTVTIDGQNILHISITEYTAPRFAPPPLQQQQPQPQQQQHHQQQQQQQLYQTHQQQEIPQQYRQPSVQPPATAPLHHHAHHHPAPQPPPPVIPPKQPVTPFEDPAIVAITNRPSNIVSQRTTPVPQVFNKPQQPLQSAQLPPSLQPTPVQTQAPSLTRQASVRLEKLIPASIPPQPLAAKTDNQGGPFLDVPGLNSRPQLLKRSSSQATILPRVASAIHLGGDTNGHSTVASSSETYAPSGPEAMSTDTGGRIRTKARGIRGRRLNRKRQEGDFSDTQTDNPPQTASGFAQSRRIYNKIYHGRQQGWAEENVDEYRGTDFDFQANLDRFDKKAAEDTTAEDDLLVSHNRLPKQRKNYRHDENVLGPRPELKPVFENGTFNGEESEATMPEINPRIARSRSRKSPQRRQNSRRAPSPEASMSDSDISEVQIGDSSHTIAHQTGGRSSAKRSQFEYPFVVSKTRTPCPALSPQQMAEVERYSDKLSFPQVISIENAGRGIAHVAMKPFVSQLKRCASEDLPVVVIFAGCHIDGARAVAAGRHLRARGFTVYIYTPQQSGGKEPYKNMRDQLYYFNFAGEGHGEVLRIWEDTQVPERPDLIIDAILSQHRRLSDYNLKEKKAVQKMISYANTLDALCLSVNIPSGLSNFTGNPLADCAVVSSSWVVAVDAPPIGLARALRNGKCEISRMWVVDSGIPQTAWIKAFTKDPREKMDPGADWTVGIELGNEDDAHNSDGEGA